MINMESALVDSDSEVGGGPEAVDSPRPRARPTVWPGCRYLPGLVAQMPWGARGAEWLARDVPRRRPPVVCRCQSLRRAEVGALVPGPAPPKRPPPRTVRPPSASWGIVVLSRPPPIPARD